MLGDMLELGPTEVALHAAIFQTPGLAAIDLIHCVGPRMKALHAALQSFIYKNPKDPMVMQLKRSLKAVVNYEGELTGKAKEVQDLLKKLVAGKNELDAVGQEEAIEMQDLVRFLINFFESAGWDDWFDSSPQGFKAQ